MRSRRLAAIAFLGALALVLPACESNSSNSDSDKSGPGAGGDATTTSQSTGDPVKDAENAIEVAFKDTSRQPPTEGPEAQKDKSVWVIACSAIIESCSVPADAAAEAGEAIGWDITEFDGGLSPDKQAEGIRQAVAAGADGIILAGIDCAKVTAPLQDAKDKGVDVISFYAFDCDDPNVGGEALETGQVNFGDQFDTYADVAKAFGRVKANYVIAKTGGEAKILNIGSEDYLVMDYINRGFEAGIATCPNCEIVDKVEFVEADLLSGKLRDNIVNALQQNPDVTAIHVPIDPLFAVAVNAALQQSGRTDLLVMGGDGLPGNMDLIRNGTETAAVAFPHEWTGWAAIDTMNRVFADPDERIPDSGIGATLVDREHNLPASGPYVPPRDFRAAYQEVWGV